MMTPTRASTTRIATRRATKTSRRTRSTRRSTRARANDDDDDIVIEAEVMPTSSDAPSESSSTTTTYELRRRTEPKRFAVAEGQLFNVATASAPIALRLTSGVTCRGYRARVVRDETGTGAETEAGVSGAGRGGGETSDVGKFPRPTKMLKIYNLHGCPFCKKVREAMIDLDLDATYYPCPRDGPEYRPFVREDGGKAQFPYLVDENTEPVTKMYESDAIIEYLYEKYGPGKANIGPALASGALTNVTAGLSLLPRLGKGSTDSPSKKPENMKTLGVWGYEGSPFAPIVA